MQTFALNTIQLTILMLQLMFFCSGQLLVPPPYEYENGLCITHDGQRVLFTPCTFLVHRVYQSQYRPRICSWLECHSATCCPTEPKIKPTPIEVTSVAPTIEPIPDEETTDEPTIEPIPDEPITYELMPVEETGSSMIKQIDCGMKDNPPSVAVVGGIEAKALDWPWMVAIFTKSLDSINGFDNFCGGTLISDSVILTAAHCFRGFSNLRTTEFFVGLGSSNLTKTIKVPVKEIILHPKYEKNRRYYDIALTILSNPIEFNNKMTPICLPRVSKKSSFTGIKVAGWGRTSTNGPTSNKLLQASVNIISNEKCNKSYASLGDPQSPEGIRSDQLCAGSEDGDKDSCYGDSGGPLTMQSDQGIHYQIGIVSYGNACANKDYPGVYTKVSEYVPWIMEYL